MINYMWDSNAQFLNEKDGIFSDHVLHLFLHQIINFFGRDYKYHLHQPVLAVHGFSDWGME